MHDVGFLQKFVEGKVRTADWTRGTTRSSRLDFSARLRYRVAASQVRFRAQGRCPRRSISLPRIMQRFRITRRPRCLFLTETAGAECKLRRGVIAFLLPLHFSPLTPLPQYVSFPRILNPIFFYITTRWKTAENLAIQWRIWTWKKKNDEKSSASRESNEQSVR